MISLQSHNQVLYHLTQLLSTCRAKTTNFSRINKKETPTSSNCDKLCHESLNETTKNFNELLRVNMDLNKLLKLPLSQKLKKREIEKIIDKLNNTLYNIDKEISIDDTNHWKVSYTSGYNFTDNKRGFISDSLSSAIDNNTFYFNNKRDATLLYYVPIRKFKTHRNIAAEKERNPPFSELVKNWLGFPKFNEEKARKLADSMDVDQFRKIFNVPELSKKDEQYIKLAFAEGYLVANDRKKPEKKFRLGKIIQHMFTIVTILLLLTYVTGGYKKRGSNGRIFNMPLGTYTAIDPEQINVKFEDVKGVTEAKQELKEVVEFLKNPEKFSALGGRLPKGVLLVGAPGTGKTLLARAVAGEAHVPFFHAAGPEFDELFVGQGAKRVRDLFSAAKERAPCVIFIDEIDSIGGKRTSSMIHPYANQTINQLLTEMDGFQQNEGVIVLGATNRRDHLDKALRRPGRFDVEVHVHKPDFKERKDIIEFYVSKILAKSLDIDALARSTTGFTGAEIENMVNQAALRAAMDGADYVTMNHLEKSREKVLMGPELKGRMPDAEENIITAYHEAGHALVAYYTKDSMPLAKVTIIPRNESLGHTSFLPKKDIYHNTKAQLLARLDTSLGGRAAEELIFGLDKVTTGAGNDLQHANQIAEAMVKSYGMSEKAGFRVGRENDKDNQFSVGTAEVMDSEIKRLLQESYDRAKSILKTHAKEHKLLAEALVKYETLDAEEIKTLLDDKKVESIGDKRTPIIDLPTNVM